MERKEILKRLGYAALPAAKVRVIVDSDLTFAGFLRRILNRKRGIPVIRWSEAIRGR